MRHKETIKIIVTAFFCIMGFLMPGFLYANIVITEVMYDVEGTDTGREWIEVRNDGQESVDLSLWKLFEANTNHKLTATGASLLVSGSFAIISDAPDKFLADHVGFQGLIFDSAFSLNNAGEVIVIRDPSGVDSDSVSYLPEWGAGGDTFSLQKTSNGVWVSAPATPGAVTTATQSMVPPSTDTDEPNATTNQSTANDESDVRTESITEASYSSQSVANTGPDSSEFEVTSGRPRLGFVGIPLDFRAKIKKIGDTSLKINHAWSMGDGTSKYGNPVSYAYRFPGDYTVILNSRVKETEAVSKTNVKILNPSISISAASSNFIEVSNTGDYEINLGGMILNTFGKWVSITEDTIVAAHSSIRLPSSSTKLDYVSRFVSLGSPLGDLFSDISIVDHQVLLPQGMDIEGIRTRFTEALKIYGK